MYPPSVLPFAVAMRELRDAATEGVDGDVAPRRRSPLEPEPIVFAVSVIVSKAIGVGAGQFRFIVVGAQPDAASRCVSVLMAPVPAAALAVTVSVSPFRVPPSEA